MENHRYQKCKFCGTLEQPEGSKVSCPKCGAPRDEEMAKVIEIAPATAHPYLAQSEQTIQEQIKEVLLGPALMDAKRTTLTKKPIVIKWWVWLIVALIAMGMIDNIIKAIFH